ncbi:hypothetical protein MBM_01227 [Drepanopeziza brunnea f. sp. 'multigermtubi' MB_m1]|uniref:Uncharacterized protein n=1 Tax=Marssonina brunnea f. sp. multigermtubi (strain MB_m1) TaxID=1072389 RepID=K1WSF3_MARBU|nr:uncharacterized protein MBM_01227 [Drepanopeziza brunnea f. sp. 'multigermtubi' MB_m1]EKD20545.1 hypothetical protein MBM_01227 [Drepanopeziza brunnea f. sp. 'multigermtubi' MB_m1]
MSSKNENILFWFFESRNTDPSEAPLTAWIIGLPCGVDIDGKAYSNPYPCFKASNMIYIDQPTQVCPKVIPFLSMATPIPTRKPVENCKNQVDSRTGMAGMTLTSSIRNITTLHTLSSNAVYGASTSTGNDSREYETVSALRKSLQQGITSMLYARDAD